MTTTVSIPLDDDGFLRRECPTCEREFKWFVQDDEADAEPVDQYYCPLCGEPAGPDEWWTPAQLEYATNTAGPEMGRAIQDSIADAFRGTRGLRFEPDKNFSLDLPLPEKPEEPNDMTIVEPPCHPNEPIKVPAAATGRLTCLVCGAAFAA